VTDIGLIILGYVLGSMPWGYWLPRALRGVDIRTIGSGNTGAANVGRTFGLWYGLAVAALDIAKGLVPALVAELIAGDTAAVLAGAAAMVGHWRPLFLGFARGGKAVATGLGVALVIAPVASLLCALIWIVVFLALRYSSVASLAGSVSLPLLAAALGASAPALVFLSAASVAIIVLHRTNIARLLHGTENRFTFSRRPRLRRRPEAAP
jgi:acyl phosphate:glycerol-3-phosphate acyltransferase